MCRRSSSERRTRHRARRLRGRLGMRVSPSRARPESPSPPPQTASLCSFAQPTGGTDSSEASARATVGRCSGSVVRAAVTHAPVRRSTPVLALTRAPVPGRSSPQSATAPSKRAMRAPTTCTRRSETGDSAKVHRGRSCWSRARVRDRSSRGRGLRGRTDR